MESSDSNMYNAPDTDTNQNTETMGQKNPYSQYAPIQITPKEGQTPEDAQRAVLNHVIKIFEKRWSWRRAYEVLWQEIYRMYFSVQNTQKTFSRSNITGPVIFQVIEAAVPKIVNTIFGSGEEFFDVVPIDPAEQQFADSIKLLLTYQLSQADFMIKFVDFCKQLLLYGTSYFYVYWKVERDWVYTRVPVRKNRIIEGHDLGEYVEWEEKKEYKVVRRRPEIEVLDILDVFPDPESRGDERQDLIVQSWMGLTEVKEMGKGQFPVYGNTESAELTSDGANTYIMSRQVRWATRNVASPNPVDKESVELLTFWGRYDLDGDGIKEKVQIIVANRKVLFVARPNPFHHQQTPIIRCVFFPVPMEWYGMGLVEPVMNNVRELWTLRRQRLDNINLVINRMWKVNSLADVDLDTLISSPNGIILTDMMDGVEPLETNDITNNAYNEATMVQADIENATAPRSVQGTPESGKLGRTAKGAQLIIGQALEKFAVGTKLVEELGIKRVIKLMHQLNMQFIDQDEELNETYGAIFPQPVNVEDLRTDIRFKMVGITDMINTEGKINQMISFFGTFAPYLDGVSIEGVAKEVWKLQGKNADDIQIIGVANPLPQSAANTQQSILGQVQNQGGQANPPQVPRR
jgi:hypothetical protein